MADENPESGVQFMQGPGITRLVPKLGESATAFLPARFYTVLYNQDIGFYLGHREGFKLPAKLYGQPHTAAERYLSTFRKLGRTMGVLLSGDKGSGKTVTASLTAIKGSESGLPVICLENSFHGSTGLRDFLAAIVQPCVILVDEFEKIFSNSEQRLIFLSLLDGLSKGNHLFLLTSNLADVGEYFISRPGRVRYHQTYGGLSPEMIDEIIKDKLRHAHHAEELRRLCAGLLKVSMDGLTAMIEEINFYNEPPSAFMRFFNVKPDNTRSYSAKLVLRVPRLANNESYNATASKIDGYGLRHAAETWVNEGPDCARARYPAHAACLEDKGDELEYECSYSLPLRFSPEGVSVHQSHMRLATHSVLGPDVDPEMQETPPPRRRKKTATLPNDLCGAPTALLMVNTFSGGGTYTVNWGPRAIASLEPDASGMIVIKHIAGHELRLTPFGSEGRISFYRDPDARYSADDDD